MIKISMKSLTNFMSKSSISRKTLVKNLKYPNTETKIPILYYREALSSIKKFHKDNNDIRYLRKRVNELGQLAGISQNKGRINRLLLNANAIENYIEFFSMKKYQLLPIPRLSIKYDNIYISATPDLYVKEKNTSKLLKLDFSKDEPAEDVPLIITHIMFDAQASLGLGLSVNHICYIDVTRGKEYSYETTNNKVTQNILAACGNIFTIWDSM